MSELFGTAQDVTGEASTQEQGEVSKYMQRAWAAFGRDPEKGLEKLGWPGYNIDEETLVALAFGEGSVYKFLDPARYDEPCPPAQSNDPRPGRGAF